MKKHQDHPVPEQPSLHRRGFFSRMAAVGATVMLAQSGKAAHIQGGTPMLNELTHEHFSGLVEQAFSLEHDGGSLVVTLIEAKSLGPNPRAGLRDPFSLIFRSAGPGHLPQRIYKVGHAALGVHDLFLVPIGPDEHGMRYQAIFG